MSATPMPWTSFAPSARTARLRQFNLSLLITDEFMRAVKEDQPWQLAFPVTRREVEEDGLDLEDPEQTVWREWPIDADYVTDRRGLVAAKVYRTLPARRMWDVIMSSTYDFAEPGFVLIDRVNEMNNNWWCENIRATNPCGEQPLPAYGACLLGSVNLTKFVRAPFTAGARFDWDQSARSSRSSPGCWTTWLKSTACLWVHSARRFCASGGTAWAFLVSVQL